MKLKFRADPKDLVIFSIFCLVLLYLSAIAVVNLHEFANYGSFSGLNPFPAFSKEYFFTTMLIFFAVPMCFMLPWLGRLNSLAGPLHSHIILHLRYVPHVLHVLQLLSHG